MYNSYNSIVFLALSFIIFAGFLVPHRAEPDDNKRTLSADSQFLILGGNGFLGGSFVAKLLTTGNVHITVLNRGSVYFDSNTRIKPYVKSLVCDRYNIYRCPELVNSNQYYDAVVDFTSYYAEDIQGVLDVLRGRFGRYIFISSDSVYEVCTKNWHGGPSREEDAKRPTNQEEQATLNKQDSYGHRKLECEEALETERAKHGINYVSLRLPDTIGPRDTTGRFWNYQIWLLCHHLAGSLGPVHLNPRNDVPMSLGFSEDVSELVLSLLSCELDLFNEAYNVAIDQIVTLTEFLEMMAETLGIKNVSYDRTRNANIHWYPSVTRGPMNITKILTRLHPWKPSFLKEALRVSCQFYKDAMDVVEFRGRRDKIIERYIKDKDTWNDFLLEQEITLGLHDEL